MSLQFLMHRLCHRSIDVSQKAEGMSQEATEMSQDPEGMSQEAAEMSQEARYSSSSRQTADSEVAAAFAEELPAAIQQQQSGSYLAAIRQQQSGSVSPSRLERYSSLTKGESADGVWHGRWDTCNPVTKTHLIWPI